MPTCPAETTPRAWLRRAACALLLCAGPASAQWRPIEADAVPPLPPEQAASWPAAVGAVAPPTRSLGLLLRLVQPKHTEAPHWPEAEALRSRVAEALPLAAPAAFQPAGAGRFVEQPESPAAAEALVDVITAALGQASHGPRAAPAERVAAETKGLLRALHDTRALEEARRLSHARRQGWPGAATALPVTLDAVDGVRVQEVPAQPATLWLLLKPAAAHPQGLVARVNLDEVLARVSRRAP